MHHKPYNLYRKTLAWIGFATVLATVLGILYSLALVFTYTERPEPFYQQTANSESAQN